MANHSQTTADKSSATLDQAFTALLELESLTALITASDVAPTTAGGTHVVAIGVKRIAAALEATCTLRRMLAQVAREDEEACICTTLGICERCTATTTPAGLEV